MITSATANKEYGQYQSIYNVDEANENTNKGRNNAYWPPIEETAYEHEKEVWENAKRLAAITYLAVEMYGEGEETDRGRCVQKGSEEIRENIINFMEEQVDIAGDTIENRIRTYASFASYGYAKVNGKLEEGVVLEEDEGNVFFEK